MSSLLDNILNVELEYVKIFSSVMEDENTITFTDPAIPDMYSHNFTFYKNTEGLFDYIVSKITNPSKAFFRVETKHPIDPSFIDQLPITPVVTVYDIYHISTSNYNHITGNPNCSVVKANNSTTLADGIQVDINCNQEGMSLEFATKRIHRKALEYQNEDKDIQFYVCYHEGIPIGNIEYFPVNGIVKLEDFDILEAYQRMGFGSSILRHLLEVASNNNIQDAYLVTDHDDSAKEMYEKCGFTKVGEKTELLFHFTNSHIA